MLIAIMVTFLLLRLAVVLLGQAILLGRAMTDRDAMFAIWGMLMTGTAAVCVIYLAIN